MAVSSVQAPRGRSKGPPPSRSPTGGEAAGLAELRVRGQRIADGEADQRALEALAQAARGVQDVGRLRGIALRGASRG